MKCTTYIDESGNTGNNLTDKDQKLFTIAAVTIPETTEPSVIDRINEAFSGMKEIGETEIKATKWIKAPKKAAKLKEILDFMRETGCQFSVLLIEKRYMVCALIVDSFLDGAYNDFEDYTWCNDNDEKKAAAQHFYDVLSDDDIEVFANVFTKPTLEGVRESITLLMSKTKDPRYLMMLAGCHEEEVYEEDLRYAVSCDNYPNSSIARSPNYTAFCKLGTMVANQCRALSMRTSIVFDSSKLCDEAYRQIYQVLRNMQASEIVEKLIGLFPWKGLIGGFSIANSKSSFVLQAADVVAASSLKLIEKVLNDSKLSAYDKYVLDFLKELLMKDSFHYVTSTQVIGKLWSKMQEQTS